MYVQRVCVRERMSVCVCVMKSTGAEKLSSRAVNVFVLLMLRTVCEGVCP